VASSDWSFNLTTSEPRLLLDLDFQPRGSVLQEGRIIVGGLRTTGRVEVAQGLARPLPTPDREGPWALPFAPTDWTVSGGSMSPWWSPFITEEPWSELQTPTGPRAAPALGGQTFSAGGEVWSMRAFYASETTTHVALALSTPEQPGRIGVLCEGLPWGAWPDLIPDEHGMQLTWTDPNGAILAAPITMR
jgi:hypothetical protein